MPGDPLCEDTPMDDSTVAPPAAPNRAAPLRDGANPPPVVQHAAPGNEEANWRRDSPVGPQANRASPTKPPAATPGGTANKPDPTCCRYSLIRSFRAIASCIGM